MDVFEFHTYRLESEASDSQATLFVDDESVLIFTAAFIAGLNAFRWGGGSQAENTSGDAEWDYVRFSKLEEPCEVNLCRAADLNNDMVVDIGDLLLVIAQWGPCPPSCFADVDGDKLVGINDLLLILAAWGPCE